MEKLKISYKHLDEIKPYKFNPRKNVKAIEVVAESIRQFGFLVPIVLDENSEIIAGHTRIEAAKLLGLKEVPTITTSELNESQIRAFRIMDNKSQEYALWDKVLLKKEFEDIMDEIDLKFTGFKEAEIKKILNPDSPTGKGNSQGVYQIEMGRVYVLGNHRLICGDASEEETYIKLIPPKKDVHMVYTDPPYGVSYSGTNNPNGREWDVIKGDNLRGEELYLILKDCFKQINQYLIKEGALYVFHASANQIIFEKALNESGFKVRQQLIWHKHHISRHSHYHWTHEPIFYASREQENPRFFGTRDNKTFITDINFDEMDMDQLKEYLKKIQKYSTINNTKKDNPKNYIHPTQKPVRLAEDFIINSSKYHETVLDPFAGSGSTLIACENRNRTCYAIELDQDFVSHIIERWEDVTGKRATTEQGNPVPLRQNPKAIKE